MQIINMIYLSDIRHPLQDFKLIDNIVFHLSIVFQGGVAFVPVSCH